MSDHDEVGALPDCICCGLWGYERGECGHWFCEICVGRDHDVDCLVCAGQADPA